MSEQTAEQAIREAAWQQALALYRMWDEACGQAYGGGGGIGYRDPYAQAEVKRCRAMLDAVIVAHNFQGTRADPMLGYVDRRTASWDCPPLAKAALTAHFQDGIIRYDDGCERETL